MPTKRKPKPTNAQRRVVGYVRISRAREDESSTRTQEAAIRTYCTLHGWFVVDIIVEPGRSAFKASRASRPGFRKAMALIEGGAADTFVVWKLDRAARNTLDLLEFVHRELAKHEAEFVSVTEHFDTTTPMGRAMMTIVAALAELESAQKQERAYEWHEDRRDGKRVPAGPPALGYRRKREVNEDGSEGDPIPNTLELDPVVAPLVQEAADRITAGESLSSVFRWITGEGVKITRPGFLSALQSPTLAGLLSTEPLTAQNGERFAADVTTLVEGEWTPVLNRKTWDELRLILTDPERRTNTSNVLRHPLRPVLRCCCGERMKLQNDNRQYQAARYLCEAKGCSNGITQGPVDAWVEKAMLDLLDDSTWRSLLTSGATTGPDPAVVEARLAAMWQDVLSGTMEHPEYAEAKALWRGQLAAAGRPTDLPNVASLREAWPGMGPAERNLVFRRVIKSLVIKRSTRRGKGVDHTRIDLVLVD